MTPSVLVTYATRYGSTKEVAEAIAAALRETGLPVDVQPVKQVKALTGYDAFVVGAPFFIGSWMKEALNFVMQNQSVLAGRPVALFALGPTSLDETEQQDAQEQFDPVLAKMPWLKPVDHIVFGGKYDPAKLKFPDSLLAGLAASPLHGKPASDIRDWDAIRNWAKHLAEQFQTVKKSQESA